MKELIEILGFTDPVSIAWNIASYVGMAMIIAAVLSPKLRAHFFVWGPLILLLYAFFYLSDAILTGLQLVVTASGALNLLNVKKKSPHIIGAFTVIVYIVLFMMGELSNLWFWLGSAGLLGIAVGLTQLPKRSGFAIMLIGGILIVIYAFALMIWVFFVLNVIFAAANLIELVKIKGGIIEKPKNP